MSHLEQVPEQLVALLLGVHEHQDFALLLPLAQQLQQAHEPVLRLPDLNELSDVLVDNAAPTDLYLHR